MSDEQIFVDTNILIYAHDQDARKKHMLARSKIEELWSFLSNFNYHLYPSAPPF